MPAFTLPFTIRHGQQDIGLVARLARPLPWSSVHAAACRAAGLDERALLYLGAGPAEGSWELGFPPLLGGCVLSTVPDDVVRTREPLELAVIAGPDAGAAISLTSREVRVGRGPDSDLVLADPSVSFRHASVMPIPTGFAVADLGSTNGVFVDGRPVEGTAVATTGSIIRVGSTIMQVQLVAQPAGGFRADGFGHAIRAVRATSSTLPLPRIPARPSAPEPPSRRHVPILSAVIGAAVGGGLALVLHNAMYLAFAAFGPAMMLATGISDKVRGRHSWRLQRREYRDSMAAWREDSQSAIAAARKQEWARWAGPSELIRRAETASARLWTGRCDKTLTVCVGFGVRPIGGATDVALPEAGDMASDMPIVIPLIGLITFAGTAGRGTLRYVLLQLAALYSPSDVAVVIVSNKPDLAACRMLPHAVTGLSAASSPMSVADAAGDRHVVVVLDGFAAQQCPFGIAAMASAATNRWAVLCFTDAPEALSRGGETAPARSADPAMPRDLRVVRTQASARLLDRMCHAAAPLRDGGRQTPALSLPDSVSLVELAGELDAESLRHRWSRPSAAAPIGAAADGPLHLDLDVHGPHVLIAGTTGSGKSELLQTLVASVAAHSSPAAVTFLLVDYKGGSAFGGITELPHVVGVVTDLDPDGSVRALASLRAELHRRERLEAAGAPKPAKLVLVIDEFATLATELPEFLSGVLDIAQRGRSLGLHLILATQRPAGVVTPAIRANISARICLRVTDPAESVDVIGVPDAARLSATVPGRAIAHIGGRAVGFQAARVSVPPPVDVEVTRESLPNLADSTGGRCDHRPAAAWQESAEPDIDNLAMGGPQRTILQELIDASRDAACAIPPPSRPWLPPLPAHIAADEVDRSTFALVDNPDQQRQHPIPAPTASALLLGPPLSGRSSALRRIADLSAAHGHELLVFDGSGDLEDLANWAAVSTYLTVREPLLIIRALRLQAEPARRPADGHLRHVLVDQLDVIMAELERTDYAAGASALTELLTRANGSVRMTASGSVRLQHQQYAVAFPEVMILGTTTSEPTPGRATWTGHTVQIVAAPRGSPPAASRAAGDVRQPIVVRKLPDTAALADLPRPERHRVTFAVGGDDAGHIAVDLTGPGGGIIVAGPRRSGVSTALNVISAQAARCGIPVIALHTGRASPAFHSGPGITEIPLRADADDLVAALRAHDGPLLLAADITDLPDDHPAAEVLERFLAVCSDGQYLLVGTRTARVIRARRGILPSVASYRLGLLLSPDQPDGAIVDAVLPKRVAPVSPGRGVWATNGSVIDIQVALPTMAA